MAAALALLAAAAVVATVVLSGEGRREGHRAHVAHANAKKSVRKAHAPATIAASTGADPARGSELNEQGYAMIQAGEYEAAVPVLEEAVASFPKDGEDIDSAYALFNLGTALRLSGRPEDAIPVLERRLQIPDQTETVQRELDAARAEAGQAGGGVEAEEGD